MSYQIKGVIKTAGHLKIIFFDPKASLNHSQAMKIGKQFRIVNLLTSTGHHSSRPSPCG